MTVSVDLSTKPPGSYTLMAVYEFKENSDTRQVTCYILPTDPSEISVEKAKAAFEQSKFADLHLFSEHLEPAIAAALKTLAAREQAESGQESAKPRPLTAFVIAERRDDSHIAVNVSEDATEAEVTLTKSSSAAIASVEMIQRALARASVVKGINESAIHELVAEAREAKDGQVLKRTVAEGVPPGPGVPSSFEYLVTPFQDRVLQPQQQEDGSVDQLDLGNIDTVKVGDVLMRRRPARPGSDGSTVTGKLIPAPTPKETPFSRGKGAQVSPENAHLLVAKADGIPHRLKNGMSVDDVLQIEEVGLRTGHIDMEGNLLVKGDVRPDMKVKLTGNLTVLGFVESATIEIDGDLTVRSGIMGTPLQSPSDDYTCVVKARNIESKYAQNAKLNAGQDIRMTSHMLHCDAKAHAVVIGRNSRDAQLAGGSVQVESMVETGVLGVEAGTAMRLVFDPNISELLRQHDETHEARLAKENTLLQLAATIRKLKALPKRPPDLKEKCARISKTIDQFRAEAGEMHSKEKRLLAEIEQLRAKVRLTVRGVIHAGVELHCDTVRNRFNQDRGPGTLVIRNNTWQSANDGRAAQKKRQGRST